MIHLLRDSEELGTLAQEISRLGPADHVAIDTETFHRGDGKIGDKPRTFMPWNGAEMSGLSISFGVDGYYIPVNHRLGRQADPSGVRWVIEALNGTRSRHDMHHAQYDWAILEHDTGFKHRWNTNDTITRAWLDDENRPKGLKDLSDLYLGGNSRAEKKALAEIMGRPTVTEMKDRIKAEYPEMPVMKWVQPKARSAARDLSWGDLYPEEMAPYAGTDATDTYALAEYFGTTWTTTMAREMRIQEVLYRMRQRGITLDPERLERAGREYRIAADRIQAKYPDYELGRTSEIIRLVYTDLGLPVLESSPKTGVPSTARNALELLPAHPVIEDVLEHRRMLKALNSYVKPLFEYDRTSMDGRIHPEFNPVGTVTGRRACSLPNLQQIPKESTLPGVRESFRPAHGLELWEYDLASAELWVGAAITKDPALTAILVEGRNMHEEMAFKLFGTKDHASRFYTLSKNVNYGIPYGAGIEQIARFCAKAGLGPKEAAKVAEEILTAHKEMFAGYHRATKIVGRTAKRVGKVPLTTPGRYRHVNSRFGQVPDYAVLNSLVQGGVGTVMGDVLVEYERARPGELLLEVHDSFVMELEPGLGTVVLDLLNAILVDVNPFSLPLRFEGKQWRSA